MTAATLHRDPLMPVGLDADGQVSWRILGAIARRNHELGDDPVRAITAAAVLEWDDQEWEALAGETTVPAPISAPQRALVVATLADLERHDRGQPDRWWDR